MKDDLQEHARKTELLGFFVYFVLIMIFVVFKKEWVLSAVVGALAGIINFRIQVKGLKSFAEKKSALYVTGNFYLRMLIVGAVLYLSFSRPAFNPYVVFSFIVGFHLFILFSGILRINK